MNLYELTQEAIQLSSLLEEEELTPELEQALVINQNELQEKSINYAKFIMNLESDSNAIDEEINRLKAIKRKKERTISIMKEAVKNAMIHAGIEKIESPLFKLSFRKSEFVEVDLVESLPNDVKVVKTTVTADKTAIKKAIKEGKNITGARLIETQNLQIK